MFIISVYLDAIFNLDIMLSVNVHYNVITTLLMALECSIAFLGRSLLIG